MIYNKSHSKTKITYAPTEHKLFEHKTHTEGVLIMIRNEVRLIRRLTAEPELKYTTNNNTAVCNTVLAVNNSYNNDADYFSPCVLGEQSN